MIKTYSQKAPQIPINLEISSKNFFHSLDQNSSDWMHIVSDSRSEPTPSRHHIHASVGLKQITLLHHLNLIYLGAFY